MSILHTLELEFPLSWPDHDLSPNARVFWAKKARVAKCARGEAYIVTRAALGRRSLKSRFRSIDRVGIKFFFTPPDRRGRDDDNLIASMKPYRDGIAEALGVDDVIFHTDGAEITRPRRPAFVTVVVTIQGRRRER